VIPSSKKIRELVKEARTVAFEFRRDVSDDEGPRLLERLAESLETADRDRRALYSTMKKIASCHSERTFPGDVVDLAVKAKQTVDRRNA